MYWGNLICSLLAPAIFLHFCLTFHARPRFLTRRWSWTMLYVPSVLLIAISVASAEGTLQFAVSLFEARWLLDRVTLGYAVLLYLAGAAALWVALARADDPVIRRQLKYLRNGAIFGILPFALFYALPYVMGVLPTHLMNLTVLSMALIPLTWAYAITRYRLMDVDIIFQQVTSTRWRRSPSSAPSTASSSSSSRPAPFRLRPFVVLISFATFVFQPIRRWIQEQLGPLGLLPRSI